MFFGSKFAYINKNDNDDAEEIADEEFSEGIQANAFKQAPDIFNNTNVAPPTSSFGSFSPPTSSSSSAKPLPKAAPVVTAAPSSRTSSSSSGPPPPQKQPVLASMKSAMQKEKAPSTTTIPMDFESTGRAAAGLPPPIIPVPLGAPPPPPPQQQIKHKKIQKADTNVVSLRLGTLAEDAHFMTGDPVACTKCATYLNAISKLDKKEQNNAFTWNCEFCNNINDVQLEQEEIPAAETLDYILEPAPVAAASSDEGSVIFCMDISGSMCVTSEIQGKLKLRGDEKRSAALQALNTERTSQYMPGQKQDVSYVSRLQCVQAAVSTQLDDLEQHFPKSPVALITFNNEVTIIGDGVQEPVVITGDKLNSFDQLIQAGQAFATERSIKDCKKKLETKLFDLEERGQTALGPAVVVAIAMAARRKGSKVIVCTDGLSNVGIGSMANLNKSNEETIEQFYNKIGTYAKENGVVVSVISIQGTDCRMENLGVLTDLTTGKVDIVNPLQLTTNFATILANPIIATNVEVSFVLHHALCFRNEESVFDPENTFKAARNIGNVTAETDISFEYGIKASATDLGLTEVPFQVQIRFTRLNGMKCVRVISRKQAVTQKRAEAEKEADIEVLALGAMQTAAKTAQKGNYAKAREKVYAHQRLMNRAAVQNVKSDHSAYTDFVSEVAELDTAIQHQQLQELEVGMDFDATESTNVDDEVAYDRYRNRKAARPDEVSKVIYQHKNKFMKKK